jgi:alkyl hydroperoxide reductase subunit AhpC
MDQFRPLVGRRAPEFDLFCTRGSAATRTRATLADYRDRWLALVFYPRDFSLVCPTELTALSARIEEFDRHGCDLLGVSTDNLESHERWISTPSAHGGLGGLHFPLASDESGAASRSYGVYLEQQRVALRGLFMIDPNGVLQYQAVHNLSVGRRSDEVLRMLAALETGGMCPEDWCASCATIEPTAALAPGAMLSHFRIESKVGEGSFAAVFRAHDTLLDRTVALKVFRASGPGSLSTPLAALEEARAAAALNHPNVCAIFAADNSEGVPFIAMEYVSGGTLSVAVQAGPINGADAARYARHVALGMAAAHSQGIVHGDLKPANILLTDEGVAKVTDFGLSRQAPLRGQSDETTDWQEQFGKVAGTPSYMSPEQSRGAPPAPASDVFSLGATLYEMLTGQKAFAGGNMLEVLNRIDQVEPDRYANEVNEPFATLLRMALVRDPGERRLTMAEIAGMLA